PRTKEKQGSGRCRQQWTALAGPVAMVGASACPAVGVKVVDRSPARRPPRARERDRGIPVEWAGTQAPPCPLAREPRSGFSERPCSFEIAAAKAEVLSTPLSNALRGQGRWGLHRSFKKSIAPAMTMVTVGRTDEALFTKDQPRASRENGGGEKTETAPEQ